VQHHRQALLLPGQEQNGEAVAAFDWGNDAEFDIDAGCLAFSLCTVPVIFRRARERAITVYEDSGGQVAIPGGRLGRDFSQSLFRREGLIRKIIVDIPDEMLR